MDDELEMLTRKAAAFDKISSLLTKCEEVRIGLTFKNCVYVELSYDSAVARSQNRALLECVEQIPMRTRKNG